MRRLLSAATVVVAAATTLAVPVLGRPVAQAHAVTPRVQSVPVVPVVAARAGGRPAAVATRLRTSFDLVGATWRAGTLEPGAARLEVRVQQHGHWSQWTGVAADDGGADAGTPDAARAARVDTGTVAAEPTWVGPSTGAQLRVVGAPGASASSLPAGVHLVLVDGGSSSADAHPQPTAVWGGDVADAAAARPTIYTRSDWGADESLRTNACPAGPDYSPTVKVGFVHHTDNANSYTRAQVPGIIRSIYAYHVRSNGWCDVGYNYLVDRFGRIWEGRYGGITKDVIGAHTGGYNYDSFGTALIGTFTTTKPSAAMLSGLEQLFAWKLGRAYRDPKARATLTAAAFSGSRHAAGTDVSLRVVSGHRDADYTDCPGNSAYALLPDIRTGVAQALGAGFVAPSASTDSVMMASGSVRVAAKVVGKQTWTLTVADASGATTATTKGTASRSVPVAATWDLTDDNGLPVVPGDYTLRLTGADADGHNALPWSTTVHVTPPVTLTVPDQVALDAPVTARGHGVPGHDVAVSYAGKSGPVVVGTFVVGSAGTWKATSPVSASRDLEWTATDTSAGSYARSRTTRVGPALTAPVPASTFVSAGTSVPVSGSALPGAGPVSVRIQPLGASASQVAATATVGSAGAWATSVTPTTAVDVWATDSRGLASLHRRVYPVAPATATAPADGYAGRHVRVHGNAGGAPVPVTLSSRTPGAAWTTVRTVTAGPHGHYRLSLPVPSSGSTLRWRIATDYGDPVTGTVSVHPVFAPTATGPARSGWNHVHLLTGTAVPGDSVTVWTRPAGGGTWTKRGSTVAADDTTWSFPLTFTADTAWRVTSRSGTSTAGSTVVAPTLSGPTSIAAGHAAVLHGRAIPGTTVTLFRRVSGSSSWQQIAQRTAASDGSWTSTRHPRLTTSYRVTSHGQTSHVLTLSVH